MNEVVVILNDPVRLGEIAAREYLDETKRTQRHIEAMALGLAAARERYPADQEFGEWLRDSDYWGLGKNDRAALIRLGEDWSDELRGRIAALTVSSPQLIARKLYPGSYDSKPEDDDEDDDGSTYFSESRRNRFNEAWDTIDPRLTAALLNAVPALRKRAIWEPAAGCGLLVEQLRAAGCTVDRVTDIAPRAITVETQDFLAVEDMPPGVSAIVTNPPWGKLAAPFVRHAVELGDRAGVLVAMLLPLPWMAAGGIADLTGDTGFDLLVVPRFRARWMTEDEEAALAAERHAAGKTPTASPKMNHVWLVWDFERDANLLPSLIFVDPENVT